MQGSYAGNLTSTQFHYLMYPQYLNLSNGLNNVTYSYSPDLRLNHKVDLVIMSVISFNVKVNQTFFLTFRVQFIYFAEHTLT